MFRDSHTPIRCKNVSFNKQMFRIKVEVTLPGFIFGRKNIENRYTHLNIFDVILLILGTSPLISCARR